MRQISRCAFAFALTITSVAASAQDAIGAPGDAQPNAITTKTKISNATSVATDSSTAVKAVSTAAKDVVQQQVVVGGTAARGAGTSEFQKFIAENVGANLPIFGADFFVNSPSTFAPILNSPVPADYPLGPGDELLIRGWGSIELDYRATIDRNGTITIPSVGSVVLGGVKAGDADGVIRAAVARLYKGVTLNVNFGQLRAITVYVVGQASRPGTYTVSNMSTLVTALFASGGPSANGSMRRVQVKRAGKVVAELDLYAFIAKGDKSADIKLQDGDSIYIPSAGGYVALVGKVNSPAIYELRTASDTIESVLDFAGGLPVVADPRRAFLERIDATKTQPRSVEQFALDADGVKKVLKNGDILSIKSITPEFSNAVVLRGNVDQSIRAPFKSGMRISDLIPSRENLITRDSVRRQNSAVGAVENEASIASRIGGLIDEINWDYAVVERVNRTDLTVSLIPFNLGQVFENPAGADNIVLQAGDTVTIFSQNDVSVPLDKRRVFVRVEGEVNVPGVYQMTPGENLQILLARAGGPTHNAYLFGTAFYREQVRHEQQTNLERVIDRLETQLHLEQAKDAVNTGGDVEKALKITEIKRQAELSVTRETIQRMRKLGATGRIAFGLDPEERSFNKLPQLKLENGDRLVVPFRPEFVHIFGAVNSESSPLWRPHRQVGEYIDKAGLRPEADLDGLFVMRVDGSVLATDVRNWFSSSALNMEVQPGDTIVIPEKNFAKEGLWSRFTSGTKEWAQIFASFGLGAAAIKVLR
jgi:protein involved in polysaccharide export with SLBB domain